MKAMRWLKRYLCILLVVVLTATPAMAAAPGINASITRENVLSLLKAYDKDGYYLVKNGGLSNGSQDFLQWFKGQKRIIDAIDTCVHEQCHGCTFIGGDQERIYRGNGKFYQVTYTDIFLTKNIAASMPKEGKIFRFKTYVSEPSPYLASNVEGIYGLLNEFTAYSYGMNNTVKLYKYFKKQASDFSTWMPFINNGANDRLAYSEFRLFMMHYLYYAKKKFPSVYKGIMNNTSFKEAFSYIDTRFRKNISTYEKYLQKAVTLLTQKGHVAEVRDGIFWCDHRGTGLFEEEYKAIMQVLNKSKYKKIYNALMQ